MARIESWEPNEKLWHEFNLPAKPSVRQKILVLTVIRVGEYGPEKFSTNILSKDLEIAAGTINYHFGSREGLIAEAAVLGYRRYVERTWEMVSSEPKNPETRLRLWLEESLAIQFEMHGWGPVLNYPASTEAISSIINEKFKSDMDGLSELNMARLMYLIEDVKKGKVREFPYELKKVPASKFLTNPRLINVAASIGWSNLGMAIWYSGRHLPTRQLSLKSTVVKQMMKFHLDQMIEMAKRG